MRTGAVLLRFVAAVRELKVGEILSFCSGTRDSSRVPTFSAVEWKATAGMTCANRCKKAKKEECDAGAYLKSVYKMHVIMRRGLSSEML